LGAPETCYLVVDRSAEIVTRPLRDFRELGQLPPGQEHKPTLPIFRNHRLARRFSTPQQRIIKMPGYLLRAAQEKLRQKGISYILLNGRVYSL
ncbi:MAG: transposase, partial [Pseudanabaenaceae cyanobacterium]